MTEKILPRPVIRDKSGKFTKDYSLRDWYLKLKEEFFEVLEVTQVVNAAGEKDSTVFDNPYKLTCLKTELADVITVCISWLETLGVDEEKRSELFRKVNEKNEKRGYFEERD